MTDSEKKLFRELRKVRFGAVVSYEDLSRAVAPGFNPRVAGNILSRNPDPIAIPCHRVVRKNGKPGGFAFGTQLKRFLISWERHIMS
jgi:O-6-methylguanine DNA methyltransferase